MVEACVGSGRLGSEEGTHPLLRESGTEGDKDGEEGRGRT